MVGPQAGQECRLLIPAAASLTLFAWLLTMHPSAVGRTYAAYGGMYMAAALVWLWLVDGVTLTRWDLAGASIALIGMAVIALQPGGQSSTFYVQWFEANALIQKVLDEQLHIKLTYLNTR